MKNSHKHESPGKNKIPKGNDEPMRARKLLSMFNSGNQLNPKMNYGKSKDKQH
jgi:hypothetical protein